MQEEDDRVRQRFHHRHAGGDGERPGEGVGDGEADAKMQGGEGRSLGQVAGHGALHVAVAN